MSENARKPHVQEEMRFVWPYCGCSSSRNGISSPLKNRGRKESLLERVFTQASSPLAHVYKDPLFPSIGTSIRATYAGSNRTVIKRL